MAGVGVVVVGYIAKHDTLDTAKVMVGVSIALGVLVRVLPRGLP